MQASYQIAHGLVEAGGGPHERSGDRGDFEQHLKIVRVQDGAAFPQKS